MYEVGGIDKIREVTVMLCVGAWSIVSTRRVLYRNGKYPHIRKNKSTNRQSEKILSPYSVNPSSCPCPSVKDSCERLLQLCIPSYDEAAFEAATSNKE